MRTVRLNDGRELPADWCGAANGALHIDIMPNGDYSVRELSEIFSVAADTEHIVFVAGEQETAFDGYTHLLRIAENEWRDGATLITLTKSED